MPPRSNLLHASRKLAIRPKAPAGRWASAVSNRQLSQTRSYSEKNDEPRAKAADDSHNMHVSEEAAAMAKAKGEQGPDLQQGTPVEEVVKGDKKAQEQLPKVMKDALKSDKPSGSRSFSTMAICRPTQARSFSTITARRDTVMDMISRYHVDPAIAEAGLDDMLASTPEFDKKARHFHNRYPNIIEQMVGLLIRDGKKAVAQRVCQLHPAR
jgi:small subunit ribosomal protein S7